MTDYLDHLRGLTIAGTMTADEAEAERLAASEAEMVLCSICDGIGHGQPGYGPCPIEEPLWARV